VPAYVTLILGVLLIARYRTIVRIFKWLTLVLFAYVAAAFLAHPPWHQVLRQTVVPHIELSRAFLMAFVAIFGTTISPYLFFWQAAQTVDDERALGRDSVEHRMGATPADLRAARTDVVTGMLFSNAVMYFIILTTGATLYAAGQRDIQAAQQAAQALRPLAGDGAALLFALGIIGTGLLGVPVLAGSAAYAIAEAGGWQRGMGERPTRAGRFYLVLVVAMLAGMAMDYARLDPIRMLFWSAVLNGLLAPPLIGIILLVCNDRRVMGGEVNGRWLNVLGGITLLVMSGAAVLLVASLL
jgi:Mn2+/Fe2+ NRAMP family transporter